MDHPNVILGYGNSLRCDDGAGPAVVARLRVRLAGLFSTAAGDAPRPLAPPVLLLDAYQLLPEHAEPLSRAARVVLVDACCDAPGGAVRVRRLPREGSLAADRALFDAHALSPAGLARLCLSAFGRAPRMTLITIGVASLEIGERLSPAVDFAVDQIAAHIAARLERLQVAGASRPSK